MAIELDSVLEKINENRQTVEASFVFSLWKDPDLYGDFIKLNEGKDETIQTEDAVFYFNLGKLYNQKLKSFDHVSIYSYLEDKPTLKKHFEDLGGYSTVEEIRGMVSPDNIDSYYDAIAKKNTLQNLAKNYFSSFKDMGKFTNMTSQDVYDYFDYQLNNISMSTDHDFEIESLEIDDAFIEECNAGQAMGISYAKICRILNYMTLGVPLGEMYMIAGHSGIGKALTIDTDVLTPNGFVKMKDVKVGDLVIGEDGKAYPVSGVFPQGMRDVYRIHFNDGTYVDCDKDHLWKFKTFKDIRKDRVEKSKWKVLSVDEILKKYKIRKDNGTYNLMIPVMKPVVDFEENSLPDRSICVGMSTWRWEHNKSPNYI